MPIYQILHNIIRVEFNFLYRKFGKLTELLCNIIPLKISEEFLDDWAIE